MDDPNDIVPGFDAFTPVESRRPPTSAKRRRRRHRPSMRMLTVGGGVWRGLGVLTVIAGFYPFLLAALTAWLYANGEVTSGIRAGVADGQAYFYTQGLPAIVFLVLCAVAVWCVAAGLAAIGHALYAVRDLHEEANLPPRHDP